MKTYTVNETGLSQIATILREHHKHGAALTRENVHAWASDVEMHLDAGLGAYIEISCHDSISGRTETHAISAAGFDISEDQA